MGEKSVKGKSWSRLDGLQPLKQLDCGVEIDSAAFFVQRPDHSQKVSHLSPRLGIAQIRVGVDQVRKGDIQRLCKAEIIADEPVDSAALELRKRRWVYARKLREPLLGIPSLFAQEPDSSANLGQEFNTVHGRQHTVFRLYN